VPVSVMRTCRPRRARTRSPLDVAGFVARRPMLVDSDRAVDAVFPGIARRKSSHARAWSLKGKADREPRVSHFGHHGLIVEMLDRWAVAPPPDGLVGSPLRPASGDGAPARVVLVRPR